MIVRILRKRILTSNRTLESPGAGITSVFKPQTASSSLTDIGPQMSKHQHASCATIFKGISEKTSKGSLLESSTEKQPPESNIKYPVTESNTCNSTGLLLPPSNIPFCSSPANSIFSATHYTEAKQTFTEIIDCASSVDKSMESGEVSNSCDLFESRKTSLYRASTGSDLIDESSASGCSSFVYKANDVRWEAIQSLYGALELKHIRILLQSGSGLAELTGTRTYFAVKIMDKAKLEGREKLLRDQTDHPFLPMMYSQFETEKAAFLVMEFCPGGDLHVLSQIQWGKYFSEQTASFHVAEIILALEYLHMLGIVYRDLKPENILVQEDGHIMLSDFGLSLRCDISPTIIRSSHLTVDSKNSPSSSYCIKPACMIQPDCALPICFYPGFFSSMKSKKSKQPSKTKPDSIHHQVTPLLELVAKPTSVRSMSFAGTHEYLAPEIIKGKVHGSAVDWWTFRISLFERMPFKGPIIVAGELLSSDELTETEVAKKGGVKEGRVCGDVLSEILSRLPLKSIGRLNIVCKGWHSLIKSRTFIQQLCSRLNSVHPTLTLLVLLHRGPITVENDDVFAVVVKDPSERPLIRNLKLPFKINTSWISLVGCINGLLCFEIGFSYAKTALWNPMLQKLVIIQHPHPELKPNEQAFGGFAYDKRSDAYKIIRVVHLTTESARCVAQVQIYNSNDNAWETKHSSDFPSLSILPAHRMGVFAGNILYWYRPKTELSDVEKLICFDATTEEFKSYDIPPHTIDSPSWTLAASGEHIAIIFPTYDDSAMAAYLQTVELRILTNCEDEHGVQVKTLTKVIPKPKVKKLRVGSILEFDRNWAVIAYAGTFSNRMLVCCEDKIEELAGFQAGEMILEVAHYVETLVWPFE